MDQNSGIAEVKIRQIASWLNLNPRCQQVFPWDLAALKYLRCQLIPTLRKRVALALLPGVKTSLKRRSMETKHEHSGEEKLRKMGWLSEARP